jgi:hypothetical protein
MVESLFIIGGSVSAVLAIVILIGAAILATRNKRKLDAS